jgi:hypothetical protein
MLDEKAVGKIGKMCTNHVQMEFFSIKNDWTAYELWVHLKKRYSSKGWSSKWATYNKLETLTYETSIADLKSKILDILVELKSQDLTIEQVVTLKVLNVLESSFSTYLTVLMESARKEDKFSDLTEVFQNLVDEENRQRAESSVNLVRKGAGNGTNGPKRGDNKGGGDKKDGSNEGNGSNGKKDKCSRCGRSPHPKEECSAVNSECTECHKTGH